MKSKLQRCCFCWQSQRGCKARIIRRRNQRTRGAGSGKDTETVMNECHIGKEPFFNMCCCNCIHYVKVCLHCTGNFMMLTRDKFGDDPKCICGVQVAWACAMPTTCYGHEEYAKGKHSRINLFGSNEHECGCEMYEPLFKVKKDNNGNYYKSDEVTNARSND